MVVKLVVVVDAAGRNQPPIGGILLVVKLRPVRMIRVGPGDNKAAAGQRSDIRLDLRAAIGGGVRDHRWPGHAFDRQEDIARPDNPHLDVGGAVIVVDKHTTAFPFDKAATWGARNEPVAPPRLKSTPVAEPSAARKEPCMPTVDVSQATNIEPSAKAAMSGLVSVPKLNALT